MGHNHLAFSLFIFSIIIVSTYSQANSTFPLVVQAPHYNITFPDSNPSCIATTLLPNTTKPTPILSAYVSGFREVQLPKSILNYSSGNEFSSSVKNSSIVISNYTFLKTDTNFTSTIINQSSGNSVGVESNYTLPNSASVSSTFTINPLSSYTVPIPRPEWDRFNCSLKNPNAFTPNCVCETDHLIILVLVRMKNAAKCDT
eukprot:TRINITY_DN1471_c0_g1_i1.p1 TRINITY_DN1471_c0_g1~~TRINITY_DN1471_c0_g1_i1.p1  ORF type:complete len:214 (+),score=37.89 TRINITY_DN1471_c0_g1_i1:40-642(+)